MDLIFITHEVTSVIPTEFHMDAIRTAPVVSTIKFPSMKDASVESAFFFLENGWTESAKRVIQNMDEAWDADNEMARRVNEINDSIIESANVQVESLQYQTKALKDKVINLEDALESEVDNSNYWRAMAESRTAQLETMRESNESLRYVISRREAELQIGAEIIADKSNTIRYITESNAMLRGSNEMLRDRVSRMEKAFAGISKGYGKLKRAFIANRKKINRQIEEIGQLTESLNYEIGFNEQIMSENADLRKTLTWNEFKGF